MIFRQIFLATTVLFIFESCWLSFADQASAANASAALQISADKHYLNFPIKNDAPEREVLVQRNA